MTLNNLDIKVSVLPLESYVRLPVNRYFHAFLQERIQNEVEKVEKKAMCHLERARPKSVRPFTQEKRCGGVEKKNKTYWFPMHLKCNELVICVFIANTLMLPLMSFNVRGLKDITLTTQCFIFILFFFCRYYNKYFVISLQNKSSLVLTIIYSKDLALK